MTLILSVDVYRMFISMTEKISSIRTIRGWKRDLPLLKLCFSQRRRVRREFVCHTDLADDADFICYGLLSVNLSSISRFSIRFSIRF